MRHAGELFPEEFWARYTDMEDRVRASAGILPCYGPAGWSGQRLLGGWEWEHGALVTVGLRHGVPDGAGPMVHVRTTVHDPHREAGEQMSIPVEDTPVSFSVRHESESWWAAGSHDAHSLVVEARRVPVDSVRLVRVLDIEPYLAGSRAHLRARRGEA